MKTTCPHDAEGVLLPWQIAGMHQHAPVSLECADQTLLVVCNEGTAVNICTTVCARRQ